jgi:hypothetical protein
MSFNHKYLARLILAAPLVVATTLSAADCSNASFQGRYGFQSFAFAVQDRSGNPGLFPISTTGVLVADGKGRVTSANTTRNEYGIVGETDSVRGGLKFTTPAGERFIPTPPAELTYEIRPDCSGTARLTSQGQTVSELPLVVVDGGREILVSTKFPLSNVAFGRLVRMDDSISEQLAVIKRLLDRVALRTGINP